MFLIAIASGQRCSSIHALSVEPGLLRWENSGVRLFPSASFLAKNQTESSGQIEIFLPVISSHSVITEDKVWCPVRALKWYLERTRDFRSSNSLFITTTAPHRPASKDSVSRWIISAIKSAGADALVTGPIRAHDTRSVSTSWALFNGVSVEKIQKAALWSNPNSFISCYLKDVIVPEASFASASLRACR